MNKNLNSLIELLGDVLSAVFAQLKLPAKIASRLTSSRGLRRHGNRGYLYLFNIWDKNQTARLHRNHFCYCFGYLANAKPGEDNAYLHLWINTARLYENREETKAYLDRELKIICPPAFKFYTDSQATQLKTTLSLPPADGETAEFLKPLYQSLISAAHPALIPLIDINNSALTSEERRALILSRPKIHPTPPRMKADELRQFSRSISKALRIRVLEKYNFFCAFCSADLRQNPHHIDHVQPWSLGGTTAFENLQPLCAPCNLKKGNSPDL